jgi:23S rRNA (guanosine2251-2'-O)-methyltransferase
MKEWIVGRNPVYEVLRARRRHFFRLLMARGVEEKGRLTEIVRLAQGRKLQVEIGHRQQLGHDGRESSGRSPGNQRISLCGCSGYSAAGQ